MKTSSVSDGMKVIMIDFSMSEVHYYYCFSLCSELVKLGVDTTLFSTTDYRLPGRGIRFKAKRLIDWQQLPVAMAKLNRFSPLRKAVKAVRYLGMCLSLIRSIYYEHPEIVHFQSTVLWADLIMIKTLKSLGIKVVYTAHNVLPHRSAHPQFTKQYYQKLYNLVDSIIVHAESNRKQMCCYLKISPSKIAVIPWGNLLLYCQDVSLTQEKARNRLALQECDKIVLFFGTIRENKGLSYLLEAFQKVVQSVPDSKLVVAGDLETTDSSFQRYESLIGRLGLGDKVLVNDRYVTFSEVPLYFIATDVVALPYLHFSAQSAVLHTAYAFKRPAIVTNVGGLPDLVENGRSGIVIPPRDAEALANAMIWMLRNPPQAQKMGEYGNKLVTTECSWDAIGIRTEELYSQVLENN